MKITIDDNKEKAETAEYSAEREAIKKSWKGEKRKLSEMKFSEKLSYIWGYYKIPIICVAIAIIAIVYMANVILTRKDTMLMGIVINDTGVKTQEFSACLGEYLALGSKEQVDLSADINLMSTANNNTPAGTGKNYSGATQIMCYVAARELDFSITDKTGLDYLYKNEIVKDLKEFLPEKIYNAFSDRLYENPKATLKGYRAIDMTGTRLAESLGLHINPVYICFQNMSGHDENMMKFLEFLYEFEFGDGTLSF